MAGENHKAGALSSALVPTRNPPYWQDLLVSLRRIIRANDLHSKRIVKNCGLTIPQVMVLNAIQALGDVTVRRIAEEVLLSQATVTIVLNRLEDRKFVEKIRNQDDKRIINPRLTAAGRKVLLSAPALLHEKFIARFESLEDWQKTQLLWSLQGIATMMEAESLDVTPSSSVSSRSLTVPSR